MALRLPRHVVRKIVDARLLAALAAVLPATAQAASWATLKNAAPGGTGLMLLLTDGTCEQTVDFTPRPGTPAGSGSMIVNGAGVQSTPGCLAITAAAAPVALSICLRAGRDS